MAAIDFYLDIKYITNLSGNSLITGKETLYITQIWSLKHFIQDYDQFFHTTYVCGSYRQIFFRNFRNTLNHDDFEETLRHIQNLRTLKILFLNISHCDWC